jgi:peptidoglycan/LPS O-acetylase OafA/YrhL
MRPPIPSLTGLRFVAALCIVLTHAIPKIAPLQSPDLLVKLASQLAVGMSLFFVLSGFVIYYNYSNTIGSKAGLYNFLVARFARLYPLYFVFVCYGLLIKQYHYQLAATSLAALPYYATLTQSWIYLPIGNASLIYQFGEISSIAWSVSTEWFFYLVFPVACIAVSSPATPGRTLWAATGLTVVAYTLMLTLMSNKSVIDSYGAAAFGPVAANWPHSFYRWLMYFSPYTRIFEFLIGCLCASVFMKLAAPPSCAEERLGRWLTAGSLLAIAATHWLMFGFESDAPWYEAVQGLHMNFGFAPFLAILIFCCARYQNPVSRLLAAPVPVLCGEASYSLYLVHPIVVNAFRYEAEIITTSRIAVGAMLQLVVVIAVSIGFSLVTWFVIEVPARRWIRRKMTVSAPALSQIKSS